jgi:hypothetical protein
LRRLRQFQKWHWSVARMVLLVATIKRFVVQCLRYSFFRTPLKAQYRNEGCDDSTDLAQTSVLKKVQVPDFHQGMFMILWTHTYQIFHLISHGMLGWIHSWLLQKCRCAVMKSVKIGVHCCLVGLSGHNFLISYEPLNFEYRQPGLLCTPWNFAQSVKFLGKNIFCY